VMSSFFVDATVVGLLFRGKCVVCMLMFGG